MIFFVLLLEDDIKIIVLGVNDDILEVLDCIIFNVLCIINNVVLMLKVIDELCGIE